MFLIKLLLLQCHHSERHGECAPHVSMRNQMVGFAQMQIILMLLELKKKAVWSPDPEIWDSFDKRTKS